MSKVILAAVAIRSLVVVFLTLSIWGSLFLYDVFLENLGEKYAVSFGWVSGVTGVALLVSLPFIIIARSEK